MISTNTTTPLKKFIIVEYQAIESIFEVMAHDEDHAQELFDNCEGVEVFSDVKDSDYTIHEADAKDEDGEE